MISYRLLTQHTVHARESLAMSCVNATVTQHTSAGDSFFLFAPCFHSCSSSPLVIPMVVSFLVAHCTTLLYSIFIGKKYINKSSKMPIWPRYYRSQLRPEYYPRFSNLHLKFWKKRARLVAAFHAIVLDKPGHFFILHSQFCCIGRIPNYWPDINVTLHMIWYWPKIRKNT